MGERSEDRGGTHRGVGEHDDSCAPPTCPTGSCAGIRRGPSSPMRTSAGPSRSRRPARDRRGLLRGPDASPTGRSSRSCGPRIRPLAPLPFGPRRVETAFSPPRASGSRPAAAILVRDGVSFGFDLETNQGSSLARRHRPDDPRALRNVGIDGRPASCEFGAFTRKHEKHTRRLRVVVARSDEKSISSRSSTARR